MQHQPSSLSEEVMERLHSLKILQQDGTGWCKFQGNQLSVPHIQKTVREVIERKARQLGFEPTTRHKGQGVDGQRSPMSMVLQDNERLVPKILGSMSSLHHLLHCAAVCRSWAEACRTAPGALSELNLSPFPEIQDAELLFFIRRFHSDIHSLNLNGCKYITDTPLIKYSSLGSPKLRFLSLRNCPGITEVGLTSLFSATAPTLQEINLAGCGGVRDEVINSLSANGNNSVVRVVKASGCPLTDTFLELLAARFDGIQHLNICYCRSLSDGAIALVCQKRELVQLHLAGTQASEAALSALAGDTQTTLEVLDLSSCRHLNDAILTGVLQSCSSLRALSLSSNSFITDQALFALASSNRRIKRFMADRCPGITDRGVAAIVEAFTGLEDLDLSGNVNVSDTSATAILTHCSTLKKLDLRGCAIGSSFTDSLKRLMDSKIK